MKLADFVPPIVGSTVSSLLRQWAPEPPIPAYLGAPTPQYIGSGTGLGGVQIDSAMQVPALWAAISLLANSVSIMPVHAFKQKGEIAKKLPDPQLLTSPSPYTTQSELIHMMMVSLLLRGNGYCRITEWGPSGYPSGLLPLHPDRVQVSFDESSGEIEYRVGGVVVDSSQIWHVRGLTIPGMPIGLSPISYAAMCIGIDLSSRTFAGEFFNGSQIPKATLETDLDVTQAQAQQLKERLLVATANREPIVLGAGTKYVPIMIKPEESQFLLTQKDNVANIARFFGIPPEMIGGTGASLTYSNQQERSIEFVTYATQFWTKRLEDSLNPLFPRGQFVKFDPSALLRMNSEMQAKVHVQEIAAKIKTPTEVRAEKNLPPMSEAQLAEINMVPLSITPTGGVKALPNEALPMGDPAKVPDDENDDEQDDAQDGEVEAA